MDNRIVLCKKSHTINTYRDMKSALELRYFFLFYRLFWNGNIVHSFFSDISLCKTRTIANRYILSVNFQQTRVDVFQDSETKNFNNSSFWVTTFRTPDVKWKIVSKYLCVCWVHSGAQFTQCFFHMSELTAQLYSCAAKNRRSEQGAGKSEALSNVLNIMFLL